MLQRFVISMVVLAGLTAGLRAEDDKKALKTGGNFEVEAVTDLAYNDAKDADEVKHKLDLYLPKGQKDFPVLFFVHGGAWKSGDKKLYPKLGELFARNGIGAVVINYRLSPKVQHPEHIKDVAKAFAWTHANIGKRGGKTDQIFVCGHSAGAHLVSLLATDESYLKNEKLTKDAIKGVIPISGVYTIAPLGQLKDVFGTDAEECKKASPLEFVKEKHAPFLILYADKDYPAFDTMAENMGKKLKECKCEASVLKIEERSHITILLKALDQKDPATQAVLEFIAKHSGLKLKPIEK